MNSSVATVAGADDEVQPARRQQVDGPRWQGRRVKDVLVAHHAVPEHESAEPVGVDELAEPGREVHEGDLAPEQPQRPERHDVRERSPPPPPPQHGVEGEDAARRQEREPAEHDGQERPVVVEVGLAQEHVERDHGERRHRRHAGCQADGQQHGGGGPGPQHREPQPGRQLRQPRHERLPEVVGVRLTVHRVGEEWPQVEEHDRPDRDAQHGDRPHAAPLLEGLIEPRHDRSRSTLRSTVTCGPRVLRW